MIKFIFDALLIAVSFLLAYSVRFKALLFIPTDFVPTFSQYAKTLPFIVLIWLAVFKLVGVYENKKGENLFDELANLIWGISLATLVSLGLLFLNRELWFSRLVIANTWVASFLFLSASRVASSTFQRTRYRLGWGLKNALIIGTGAMGDLVAKKIEQNKNLGLKLCGSLDETLVLSNCKETINRLKIDLVIIATTALSHERVLDLITECERTGLEFKIVPGTLELIASRVDADELAGIPLLTVSEIRLKGLNALLKRVSDVVLSTLCIVLFSPMYLILSLLVKLTSAGPIFFIQQRIGKDNVIFPMYKFRSMIKDAEKQFPQLALLSEVEGHIFKMKNDPRITPLGKLMRRYSLDEYPQLFNVLFGQMSMVGPRPPLPHEVAKYSSWHLKRLRVAPGITGLWQVSGRSSLPFEDMVRLDIYYIENWSLWLDFKILLRTIPVVIFGRGAY